MNHGKILYVSPYRATDAIGGREQLSRLHRAALRSLFGDDLLDHFLPQRKLTGVSGQLHAVSGQIDGANHSSLHLIIDRIDAEDIGTIWFDGTNLGWLAQAVKKRRPKTCIISFAHNVEAAFFTDAARRRPGAHSLGVLFANWIAERKAMQSSDLVISLSQRDGAQFQRLYGRSPDAILPLALATLADGRTDSPSLPSRYLLFVGGGFYANRDGISWYAKKVAPQLSVETLVVGQGMEDLRDLMDHQPNMRMIGKVDDLRPYYAAATAVVAPIFSGSGMKTKVAEAWMFGKKVIGTAEAFVGYEIAEGCQICDRADDFVSAINNLPTDSDNSHQAALKAAFAHTHSEDALNRALSKIMTGAK
nr:glycosyltransferase [uncultured Sphingomonas sp.]